ncbi:MAG: DNA polymerase IV [Methylococcaceae bacterium]|nr:DNA polymerase IV [Methylococcaceae bacterium]
MPQSRKIIHIDMDAFFAAVEQRDFPQYRNKPIVVGGSPYSRGVVSTCSYEARQYGIHSAMPSITAYRLCPQAIFVKPRMEAYREASVIIRRIFARYSELFEPLSLDEAYLDVSDSSLCKGSATLIAKQIKNDIKQQTQLIASAGVSYNKFLAKIASDMDKPNGLYLIKPEQGAAFVEKLKVSQFHGIGKATSKKMHALGIETGKDLKKYSLELLQQHFGKAGQHYYDISRGIDLRPVNNNRISKSVGVEITFEEDILEQQQVLEHLQQLLKKALLRLKAKQMLAQTLTVKIKYHDFVQITRSRTVSTIVLTDAESLLLLEALLKNTDVGKRKIRLLGVSLSSLKNQSTFVTYRQLDIFNLYD